LLKTIQRKVDIIKMLSTKVYCFDTTISKIWNS